MNRFITLAFAALFAVKGYAQDTRQLSLDEAVTLSLQNSKEIKLSNAKIREATASCERPENARLPDLSVTGSYMRLNQPDVNLKVKLGGTSTTGGESGSSSGTSAGT